MRDWFRRLSFKFSRQHIFWHSSIFAYSDSTRRKVDGNDPITGEMKRARNGLGLSDRGIRRGKVLYACVCVT